MLFTESHRRESLSFSKIKSCYFHPELKCFDMKMTGILFQFYFHMQFSPSKKPSGFRLDQTTIRLEIQKDINHAVSDYKCPSTSSEALFQHHFPYSLIRYYTINQNHRIVESLRLEKTSKIVSPSRHPNPTMPAKPCPEVPHPHGF